MSEAKKDYYCALLARNHLVRTFVKSEDCVGMPEGFAGIICLEIGLNLPAPIRDLRVDSTGIFAGLSFQRRYYDVFVPWGAVACVNAEIGIYDAPAPPPPAPAQDNVIYVDFKRRCRA